VSRTLIITIGIRRFSTYAAAGLDATHARHIDIEEHKIRMPLMEGFDSFIPGSCLFYRVASGFEGNANSPTHSRFIVHHEDLHQIFNHLAPPLSWAV